MFSLEGIYEKGELGRFCLLGCLLSMVVVQLSKEAPISRVLRWVASSFGALGLLSLPWRQWRQW